ncbi:MAG: hypothetical protein GY822_15745 [Deltaproteobacteria bacterium]|nr:hypothetical protein [Deltaproteobacteria bacterium]
MRCRTHWHSSGIDSGAVFTLSTMADGELTITGGASDVSSLDLMQPRR